MLLRCGQVVLRLISHECDFQVVGEGVEGEGEVMSPPVHSLLTFSLLLSISYCVSFF